MLALWMFAYIMVKAFPLIAMAVGMFLPLYLFAAVALVGAIFVMTVLPETNNKSFDEIMVLME